MGLVIFGGPEGPILRIPNSVELTAEQALTRLAELAGIDQDYRFASDVVSLDFQFVRGDTGDWGLELVTATLESGETIQSFYKKRFKSR